MKQVLDVIGKGAAQELATGQPRQDHGDGKFDFGLRGLDAWV